MRSKKSGAPSRTRDNSLFYDQDGNGAGQAYEFAEFHAPPSPTFWLETIVDFSADDIAIA